MPVPGLPAHYNIMGRKHEFDVSVRSLSAKMPAVQLPARFYSTRNPATRLVVFVVVVLLYVCVVPHGKREPVYPIHNISVLHTKDRMAAVAHQTALEIDRVRPVISSSDVNGTDELGPAGSAVMLNCDADIEHLRALQEKYELSESDEIQYYKRYIAFKREPIDRLRHTQIEQNFLPQPDFYTIDLAGSNKRHECDTPLEVPVTKSPYPAQADLKDFMFAVSTTYSRLNDTITSPIQEWAYWLTDSNGHSNGGKLLLFLVMATDEQLEESTDRLARAGIDADVYHSDPREEMAVRYLGLVPTLYSHSEAHSKKWLVLCDDDTFFPSAQGLVEKLKEFDHQKPLYIGTLSEDVGALERHGSQAFGGAGVFLTLPMAKQISQNYGDCTTNAKIKESNSGWGPQGDILLRKCIYENSDIRLTPLWDIWQLDLFGHAAGFYEGGIKPLSVHHFKGNGWHYAYPFQGAKIAHACGEDCTFQRFVTADHYIIANGYSVARYNEGTDSLDLNQFEGTFYAAPRNRGWNLDYMFGPQRPDLTRTGKKVAWELREAHNNEDGSVTQIYILNKDDERWTYPPDLTEEERAALEKKRKKNKEKGPILGEPMQEMDGILELVWLPA